MHNKIDSTTLQEIGLTSGEAKTYCALVEKMEASAPEIARMLGIQKSTAYFCLEKLAAKGLASQLLVGRVRTFYPAPLKKILEQISEKEKSMEAA